MTRPSVLVLGALAIAATAQAQATAPRTDTFDAARTATAVEFAESDRPPGADYVGLLLDRARETSRLLPLLVRQEDDHADEQIGATSSASGSTTLVSKGTVPKIISFAVENGAMTRSVSTIANRGFFQLDRQGDAALALQKRLSVSASFDTSRGNAAGTPNTFTADQQQLSQWTARLQVINNRDNQGRKAMNAWRRGLQGKLLAIASASGDLSAAFTEASGDPRLRAWYAGTVADLTTAKRLAQQAGRSSADVVAALVDVPRARERLLPRQAELSDTTHAIVSRWDASATEVVAARDRIRKAIQGGALVALEYTSDRPVRAPSSSPSPASTCTSSRTRSTTTA
jgi:hypothetical protein